MQAWQDAWEHFTPFLRFEDEVRRVVYTTYAIEALNRQLREAIKTKGHFPSEDAAPKVDLPRDPERDPAMDPQPSVDESAARVQDRVRRPDTQTSTTLNPYLRL